MISISAQGAHSKSLSNLPAEILSHGLEGRPMSVSLNSRINTRMVPGYPHKEKPVDLDQMHEFMVSWVRYHQSGL